MTTALLVLFTALIAVAVVGVIRLISTDGLEAACGRAPRSHPADPFEPGWRFRV